MTKLSSTAGLLSVSVRVRTEDHCISHSLLPCLLPHCITDQSLESKPSFIISSISSSFGYKFSSKSPCYSAMNVFPNKITFNVENFKINAYLSLVTIKKIFSIHMIYCESVESFVILPTLRAGQ